MPSRRRVSTSRPSDLPVSPRSGAVQAVPAIASVSPDSGVGVELFSGWSLSLKYNYNM
ncbi:MAG: hypothetical protein ACP5D7_13525 [Limnospira sp.]